MIRGKMRMRHRQAERCLSICIHVEITCLKVPDVTRITHTGMERGFTPG